MEAYLSLAVDVDGADLQIAERALHLQTDEIGKAVTP